MPSTFELRHNQLEHRSSTIDSLNEVRRLLRTYGHDLEVRRVTYEGKPAGAPFSNLEAPSTFEPPGARVTVTGPHPEALASLIQVADRYHSKHPPRSSPPPALEVLERVLLAFPLAAIETVWRLEGETGVRALAIRVFDGSLGCFAKSPNVSRRARRKSRRQAVESVYRLSGPEAVQAFVDELQTAVRCPACKGLPPSSGRTQGRPPTWPCNVCKGHGVLRPVRPPVCSCPGWWFPSDRAATLRELPHGAHNRFDALAHHEDCAKRRHAEPFPRP